MINIDDQCLMCRRTIEQITNDGDDFEGTIDEGIICNRCKFIQEHELYKKAIQRCFGMQRLKEENERLEEENEKLEYWNNWLESTRVFKFYFGEDVAQKFCITDEVYQHTRKMLLDEIRTKVKADSTIAEDYYAIIKILDQIEKGDMNNERKK